MWGGGTRKILNKQTGKMLILGNLKKYFHDGIIIKEMNPATQVQTQDEAVYISHNANTLGKGMNLTILPSISIFHITLNSDVEVPALEI